MSFSLSTLQRTCTALLFVCVITASFMFVCDHSPCCGLLTVAAQASLASANVSVSNNLTVTPVSISLGSTLHATGSVTAAEKPLADTSVFLYMGEIKLAYTQTNKNGDYSFAIPFGVYYFPAALSNGATIYTVVEPHNASLLGAPSAVTAVSVDLLPLYLITAVIIAVILMGLYLYSRRMRNKAVLGLLGKRLVKWAAQRTATAQAELPLAEVHTLEQGQFIADARPGGMSEDEPAHQKRFARPHSNKLKRRFLPLSRIYIDFSSNLKMLFRGRGSFFWVLAFPVILMLVFGSIYSGNIRYELAIQNLDGSNTSIAFIQAINSTNTFKVHTVKTSENADAYIKSNQISAMLIIPAGFGKQVQQNVASKTVASTAVQVNPSATGQMINNTTVSPAELILKVNQASLYGPGVIGVVNGVAKSFYSELTKSGQIVNVTNEQVFPPHFKFIDFFVPTVISLAILTTGVLGTVGTNTQYRSNGILTKLATTPFKKSEWLIAKILYQCVVIFISTGLIIVVAKLVYNVRLVPSSATLLLLFAGAICFTGVGMIIARFVKDEDAATAAASAVMFPMLFLAGIFIPLEQMPDYLQAIAKALPLMYLNLGLRDAMVLGDTASALYNMSLVLIAGVVFFIIGAIVTDWREVT